MGDDDLIQIDVDGEGNPIWGYVSTFCDIDGCNKPAIAEREISPEYGMASLCEEHF